MRNRDENEEGQYHRAMQTTTNNSKEVHLSNQHAERNHKEATKSHASGEQGRISIKSHRKKTDLNGKRETKGAQLERGSRGERTEEKRERGGQIQEKQK